MLFSTSSVRGNLFTVTNLNDSGGGSLRQAILEANTNAGNDTINFNISGSKPFSITVASPLPVVSDPLTIDGSTQLGYTNAPVVELSGAAILTNAVGLQLDAGASGSTVRGLAINRFTSHGLVLNGTANSIEGNFIGIDTTGTNARGNSGYGILITGADNHIGGTNTSARNVLSGNGLSGLCLNGIAATRNLVQGNYIGTDVTGSFAVSNRNDGITINNAPGNTNGPGNLISGNTNGISLIGANATANFIIGNFIGTDATGKTAIGNHLYGIYLTNSPANTIGGTTNAGNLISGNWLHGVVFNGSSSNLVLGNLIGLASGGTNALPNQQDGIFINGGQANTVGGGNAATRNVISGNGTNGVAIVLRGDNFNTIAGNYIGTDIAGLKAIPNLGSGVWIRGCTNLIGGTKTGNGNVISGNGQQGVWLAGTGTNMSAAGNQIFGNLIGLDSLGATILGNGNAGIGLSSAAGNQIGGNTASQRNIISGNGINGIFFAGNSTTNNLIQANYIGTDAPGTSARGNSREGIYAESVGGNQIGGLSDTTRNVISGNGSAGISLTNTSGFIIQGNYIGLNASGTSAIGNGANGAPANGWPGIRIQATAANWIGGLAVGARNVISGNYSDGVLMLGSSLQSVQGNFIGLDATGSKALGNLGQGIQLYNSSSNLLGGVAARAGNVISANRYDGIFFNNASQNTLQANYIGLAADGISPLGNTNFNVECDSGCTNNLIGGPDSGAGNAIAYAKTVAGTGNYAGVRVRDGAFNNLISHNAIFNNDALGIDLGSAGTNAIVHLQTNSVTNGNRGQNYPWLTNVISGTSTLIRGWFDSGPNKTYSLEFFAGPAGDPSGLGEGQVFLGQTNFTLGAICPTNFAITLPATVPPGWVVTATATDSANNTSEFSNYATNQPMPALQVGASPISNQLNLTWSNSINGLLLMESTNLSPPDWVTANASPVLSNGINSVIISSTNGTMFYRLTVP